MPLDFQVVRRASSGARSHFRLMYAVDGSHIWRVRVEAKAGKQPLEGPTLIATKTVEREEAAALCVRLVGDEWAKAESELGPEASPLTVALVELVPLGKVRA